jgi:hypothetical protein
LIPQAIRHLEVGVKNDTERSVEALPVGMAYIRNRDLEKAGKE